MLSGINNAAAGPMGAIGGAIDNMPKGVKIAMGTGALPGGLETFATRIHPGMPGMPALAPTNMQEAMPSFMKSSSAVTTPPPLPATTMAMQKALLEMMKNRA
jgi:hypothetical protein